MNDTTGTVPTSGKASRKTTAGYAPVTPDGTFTAMRETTGNMRRRRAGVLRGTVETLHATTYPHPTHHLDPLCPGFEKVEEERRAKCVFPDADALADDENGRLCRICTLESVLRTVLRPRCGDATVFVTFSSRPPSQGRPTESGQARLRRVGKARGLGIVETTTAGTIAYGNVPTRALTVLERNVLTHQIPWMRGVPDADHLECFWTLLSDIPEIGSRELRRAWNTAHLLVR